MQKRIPLALTALLACACISPALAGPTFSPGRIPALIVPAEVTINGDPRPDLGRSFSDTIAGRLLNTQAFTIIEPKVAKPESESTPLPPPEEIVADQAATSNAHYAFIPRMVVEENYNRLTLKKVRISDGEVVNIYETSVDSLDRAAMFELVDDTMKLVYADISRDRSRQSKADRAAAKTALGTNIDPDPEPVVAPRPPSSTSEIPREQPEPPRLASKPVAPLKSAKAKPAEQKRKPKVEATPVDVADAEEATDVAEYAGRVRAVNTDWHFCIIEVAKRGMLKVDDELLVRGSTSLEPLGKLRVSKVEGSQVVADSIDLPLEMVRPGFKAYRWTPKPAEETKER